MLAHFGSLTRRLRRSRSALLDPSPVSPVADVIFFKQQEMTMLIEQHIEELRAELRNAVYGDERKWIVTELATAEAKLAEEEAAFEVLFRAEPPE